MGEHINRLNTGYFIISDSNRISRACVAGLQLTYTIFCRGMLSIITFTTSSCIPASGRISNYHIRFSMLKYKLLRENVLHVACKKTILCKSLISELRTASLTASSIYSIPITFPADQQHNLLLFLFLYTNRTLFPFQLVKQNPL